MRGEASASLTVAVVMIPQSVATRRWQACHWSRGSHATFLPMVVAVLFGELHLLCRWGLRALTSVLVRHGPDRAGRARQRPVVALAAWLALLSGLLQAALGCAGPPGR